jgi:hypothetical protein
VVLHHRIYHSGRSDPHDIELAYSGDDKDDPKFLLLSHYGTVVSFELGKGEDTQNDIFVIIETEMVSSFKFQVDKAEQKTTKTRSRVKIVSSLPYP